MADQIKQSILDNLAPILGPAFPISHCDQIRAFPAGKTIRNMRSLRQIPEDCFIREGSRVLIVTEPFLEWFSSRLVPDRQPEKASCINDKENCS